MFERHARQVALPGIGPEGQDRLSRARAVIVGCGALGTTAADLLTRAGVGSIALIDRDVVEISNLQRQTLFNERDALLGRPKAEAAREALLRVAPTVSIDSHVADLTPMNALQLLASRTPGTSGMVGIDCTDNFETRYLINDACVSAGIPLIYGAAVGALGMNMTILPGQSACLRCVFEDPPRPGAAPTCETAGVLGPVAALVASRQAAEAIKLLTGAAAADPCLRSVDLWSNEERALDLRSLGPRADCPCCGQRRFAFLQGAHRTLSAVICTRDGGGVQIRPGSTGHATSAAPSPAPVTLEALAARLGDSGDFRVESGLLRGFLHYEQDDAGRALRLTVFPDLRAVIRGTDDIVRARAIYARYIGV
ncbi:MAG: ThiF family adenylyltransferase [Phycisphaerae bacterium]|nr:ThiF family adenylyltransferase [Phycisphaerae bacterium]